MKEQPNPDWPPILYKGFYDVPCIFVKRHKGMTILFDCPFDEVLEDDSDSYRVYLMPELSVDQLPKDWTTLAARAKQVLGEVPVSQVRFDPTRRHSVDPAIIDEIVSRKVG